MLILYITAGAFVLGGAVISALNMMAQKSRRSY